MNTNTNKTKSSLILVCGLALAALPAAFANDYADAFKLADTNGDGRISRIEHQMSVQTMFGRLDTNNDGVVTVTEMNALSDTKKKSKLKFWDKKEELSATEKISVLDVNGDGQLTRAENEASGETLFARMDTDNDGYLTKDECEKGHKQVEKQLGK